MAALNHRCIQFAIDKKRFSHADDGNDIVFFTVAIGAVLRLSDEVWSLILVRVATGTPTLHEMIWPELVTVIANAQLRALFLVGLIKLLQVGFSEARLDAFHPLLCLGEVRLGLFNAYICNFPFLFVISCAQNLTNMLCTLSSYLTLSWDCLSPTLWVHKAHPETILGHRDKNAFCGVWVIFNRLLSQQIIGGLRWNHLSWSMLSICKFFIFLTQLRFIRLCTLIKVFLAIPSTIDSKFKRLSDSADLLLAWTIFNSFIIFIDVPELLVLGLVETTLALLNGLADITGLLERLLQEVERWVGCQVLLLLLLKWFSQLYSIAAWCN